MDKTQKSIREDFQDFADSILWSNDDGSEKYIAVGNMADWWLSKYTQLLQTIESEIEGERKYHKEFECNGAHGGKGCFETFCEDQNCRNAPKEFNSGLDSAKAIISKYKEK